MTTGPVHSDPCVVSLPSYLSEDLMQRLLRTVGGLLAVSAVLAGCAKKSADGKSNDGGNAIFNAPPAATPVDTKASEDEIRKLDETYFVAVKAKDANAIAALYTEDAVSMNPNAPAVVGREAIAKNNQDFLKLSQLEMTGGPETIQVSDDGTMAYDRGKYSMSWTDGKGKTIKDEGKYLEVLKKVDGKWKIVSDANSSNIAPPK